jgi:hypothetical protein
MVTVSLSTHNTFVPQRSYEQRATYIISHVRDELGAGRKISTKVLVAIQQLPDRFQAQILAVLEHYPPLEQRANQTTQSVNEWEAA